MGCWFPIQKWKDRSAGVHSTDQTKRSFISQLPAFIDECVQKQKRSEYRADPWTVFTSVYNRLITGGQSWDSLQKQFLTSCLFTQYTAFILHAEHMWMSSGKEMKNEYREYTDRTVLLRFKTCDDVWHVLHLFCLRCIHWIKRRFFNTPEKGTEIIWFSLSSKPEHSLPSSSLYSCCSAHLPSRVHMITEQKTSFLLLYS